MTYSIYCITNIINDKQYVGMTSRSVDDRWKGHVEASKYECMSMYNSPLQADIREYGEDCFVHRVLVTTEDKELAMQLEDEATIILNTHVPNGYNRIIGNHSEHTEVARRKLSESKRGENNHNYGKHLSEETRRKLSESKSGENHPMYGKHHTEETKKKMSLKASKPVMCVETGVVFDSCTEASRWAELKSESSISNALSGRSKTAGDYHWEYALNEE